MSLPEKIYFRSIMQSCRILVVAVFVLFVSGSVFGQEHKSDSLSVDSTKNIASAPDTVKLSNTDSLARTDTAVADSAKVLNKEEELGIKISKDALPAAVTTFAKDSAVLDMKNNQFYLYGEAKANYQEIEIKSGKLIFNQKTNVLSAEPLLDTAGKKVSVQEFKQGEEKFTYDTLKYNFKSKRAIVRNAHSQYGDGYVISEQVKRNPDESIYGYHSIYTTCNLDHPHFGIRAKKIKVIPGRVIASGPANLEIMDIPTPLFLPFGMFPIKQGQRSGFILPTYSLQDQKGLGLQRGGYYFAVNDYLGIISQFDVFSKGSWATFNTAQYAKRYQYNGTLSISYSFEKTGEVYEPNTQASHKDFNVTWNHQVDPKAKPGTTFSAAVNFGTSTYNQRNGMDLNNILNNQYSSSISYGKTWVGKPYSLTVALRHSQSTGSGSLSITLPEINFNLGQFSPFQRKVMSGSPRWYEKITASYSVSAVNKLNTYDSLFGLSTIAFNDMDNGIRHTANIQANYNVFRYFNWNISVPYSEYWNTKQVFLYRNASDQKNDTTIKTGFFTSRTLDVSTGVSTRIYGMKTFKKGKIAGLRHVLTPTAGLSFVPGYSHSPFNYLYQNTDERGYPNYYSPYAYSPIGGPPVSAENQGSITFGLNNTLQMKVRNKDTTGKAGTKIINLIDAFSINSRYNMVADSNNLGDILMNFRTSVLGIFNINASANYNAYRFVNGRITKDYLINTGGGLAQLRYATFGLSMSFKGAKKNEKEQEDEMNKNGEVKRLLQNGGINDYYDFNIPWNLSINAGLNVSRGTNAFQQDTFRYTPNFTFNGGFNLTERWKVNLNGALEFNGFKQVKLSALQFDISRDLHCWQMSLNLIPFGYYRSFFFTLQVKSSVLQDLKLTRRKSYQDNSY
jgi:lipopolysaccharide assembly outer membrane protein LptD (OstA)